MLYNEQVISDTAHSVGIYEGNQGKYLKDQGDKLKESGDKDLEMAKKIRGKQYDLTMAQGMNNLANNDQLSSNPQALGAEMDKLAKNVLANITDDETKVDVMTNYELNKMSYLNKATANMKRIQAENARATTYDSVYDNLESLSLSFSNGVSGQGDENDITNFQYSLAKLRENANARNLDGTFMFTEAQRRAIIKDADSSLMAGFLDSYSKMSDSQRASVRSRLANDYFNIAVKKPDFKYRGNISLDRPVYKNADGSVSSERTITVTYGDKNYIIPTIRTEGGKRIDMTPEEAMNWFEKTGEHLGAYGKGEEKELKKAEEGIHSRYEGVDLRDVVGEKAYNDIKRNIDKFEAAVLYQQKVAKKQQRDQDLEDFVNNPTESGLEYLRSNYAFSDKKNTELDEILNNTPNYDAVTTFKDAQDMENRLNNFLDSDFNSFDEASDLAITLIDKAKRTNAKGTIALDQVENFSASIFGALRDENKRRALQELSEYKRTLWEKAAHALYYSGSISKSKYDVRKEAANRKIENLAIEGSAIANALALQGNYEEAKKVLGAYRKKAVIAAHPELADKEIGDRIVKDGIVYEITGEDSLKPLL